MKRRGAYYNENNKRVAQWLRNLITAGLLAPGEVDDRSIEDVCPDDLKSFIQCHFFAGIGIWPLALRKAGFADDREVWTGSCPCQPFSQNGKREGFADERHLWPAWNHLILGRRPKRIYGEQIASEDGLSWLDLVQADLEAQDYAFGAVDLCAAGFGAPHVRQRLHFVADSDRQGLQRRLHLSKCRLERDSWKSGLASQLGHSGATTKLETRRGGRSTNPRETNGFWEKADWLSCQDNRWRAVEPGTFPLVDGDSQRMVEIQAYGNALNAETTRHFVQVTMEV